MLVSNVSDEVYERLRISAAAHRRSLNGEAISLSPCLNTLAKKLETKLMTLDGKLLKAFSTRAGTLS